MEMDGTMKHSTKVSLAIGLTSASLALFSNLQTQTIVAHAASTGSESSVSTNEVAVNSVQNGVVNPTKQEAWYQPASNAQPRNSLNAVSNSNQQFLDEIKPGAIKAWQQYKVLPSLTAAQAIVESGWGSAAPGNNLFGIKAGSNWTGKRQLLWTSEYINGSYVQIQDWFRAYDSIADSIVDHAKVVAANWPNATGNISLSQAVNALEATVGHQYATSPTYVSSILSIANSNNLTAWDTEAQSSQESESIAQIVYTPGYGVIGFTGGGSSISGSNTKFMDGTRWQTFGSKVINGEEMYDVGGGQFVPKRYTDHYDDGVITIHYATGYGVNAVHGDGTQIAGSNAKFKAGTRWKITGVKEINGQIYYQVATDVFIAKQYTQWGAGK